MGVSVKLASCRAITISPESCDRRAAACTGARLMNITRRWTCESGEAREPKSGMLGLQAQIQGRLQQQRTGSEGSALEHVQDDSHIEVYRVKCPERGVKIETVPLLPSKTRFSQRFEEAVGQACEGASARQVARRFGLPDSTVRAIDRRYLERWAARRRRPALRQIGVDEIDLRRQQKFVTVVCNV